jgi:hypothetical protein
MTEHTRGGGKRRWATAFATAALAAVVADAQQLTLNVPPLGTCDPFTGFVQGLNGGPGGYKVSIGAGW